MNPNPTLSPQPDMVLVPREPTHEMLMAVDGAYGEGGDFPDMWEAAIAASQPAAQGLRIDATPLDQQPADSWMHGALAASPQPVSQPGEALPAEQPKSEIAYPTSASGGNDLQTALLKSDALTMAMRLYGESDDTFAPETREVMARWRPVVEKLLRGEA